MSAAALALALAATVATAGCRRQGCLGGDDGACVPPSACQALRYSCAAGGETLQVAQFADATKLVRSRGPKAQAAVGDFLLANDRVRIVLDEPRHPQGLAPSGGSIIDFATMDSDPSGGDQTNGIFQAAGVLPRDAVHYESWQVINQSVAAPGAAFVAVVFRGHLEGDRRVSVVTRYELRPCEPGVRVRTDLYNGAPDANTLFLADGLFWGDNTLLPFIPVRGHGFRMPDLDLLKLWEAWREWPFVAARSQVAPQVSYAVVPCNHDRGAGFNQTTLSAAGVPLRPTLSGDGISYERFIIAAGGPGLAPAVSEALLARAQLTGDPAPVTVTGRVLASGAPVPGNSDGRASALLIYEPAPGADPDLEAGRTPWTEAVPGADGRFTVALPPDRSYRLQPYAFGRPIGAPASIAVGSVDLDAGDLSIQPAARLQIRVEGDASEPARFAELVLIPVDRPPVAPDAQPSLYGDFAGCQPMLGPPHGGSPACNRALVVDGKLDLQVPPGHYFVYATRGPFATLDRTEVTLAPGDTTALTLTSRRIFGLPPTGWVSGDFHVHGAGSYDSQIPDQDRAISFLAADVNVVVASDHDVVSTYQDALSQLAAADQMTVIPGVEATPNLLWFSVPGESFPKTVGHFNFWPLTYDPSLSRNGAPWDELLQPGALMDAMEPLYSAPSAAVRQLNHPLSDTKLGRDQGFLHMLKYDPRTAITPATSFAADVLLRRPGGGRRNIDWDVQEVMTGASRRDWLRYRTLWFSLLSQGFLRAGAANSDSHSLGLERVGYPRNLIFGGHDATELDLDAFDADVRAGHMVGSNGPVLEVTIDDDAGLLHGPGLTAFAPRATSQLSIDVTAAPWIPVTDVRVFVNGAPARTIDVSPSFAGLDHFGAVVGRAHVTVPLAELLEGIAGDAWIVVEAGLAQEQPPDDEDGVSDGFPDLPDTEVPTRPRSSNDPRFDLEAIAPGVWPTAFTNPFLLNRDGGDWVAPGLSR